MALQEQLSQVWDALKDYLIESLIDQTNAETFIWNWIKKTSKGTTGRTIDIRYRIGRNWSAGARGEREALPVASARAMTSTVVTPKWLYYPVELTGQEIRQTKGDKGALIDIMGDAFIDRQITADFDLERMGWLDGGGRVCRVLGAPVTNENLAAGDSTKIPAIDEGVIHMLKEGMSIDFYTSAGTPHNLAVEILEVDIDTGAIILNLAFASSTIADDDYFYIAGNYSATHDKELTGLGAHISATNPASGLYQGVDRTAIGYKFLKANILDNSATLRVITNQLLRKMLQAPVAKGGEITRLVMNQGVRNSFIMLLESLGQPTQEVVEKTGNKAITKFVLDGKALSMEESILAPANKIYGIAEKHFELREFSPLGWDTLGGDKLNITKEYDVQWGRMVFGGEMICLKPDANSLLADIKEDSIT